MQKKNIEDFDQTIKMIDIGSSLHDSNHQMCPLHNSFLSKSTGNRKRHRIDGSIVNGLARCQLRAQKKGTIPKTVFCWNESKDGSD